VLEPQSTLLFVLLVLIFAGLMWWLIITRQLALRIFACCMSFLVAMFFGVLAVNKYFSYYPTWGAAIADLTNQGPNAGPEIQSGSLLVGLKRDTFDEHEVILRLAVVEGYTLRIDVTGPLSHITRAVYIYLPPQYFWPQYKNYRFPVIELIHGQPGEPQDWINVVGIQVTLDHLVNTGAAKPVVLVMPDANGGNAISLQCLNQVGGPQDLTYLAVDVPTVISRMLRVQAPGPAWGVAGYSEGGFCAANMALRFRYRYGFAASMSGYFVPFDNKLSPSGKMVSPFGNSASLRRENTPIDEVRDVPGGAILPQFWLGAGKGDKVDVDNAEYFWQELQLHEANVPLILTPGGGHTMGTWHVEVPPMLVWMTDGLANVVARIAAHQAAHPTPTHSPARKPVGKRHPGKSASAKS